jgi:hypothetical protein
LSAIAGSWRWDGGHEAAVDCARMLKALALYGPDELAQSGAESIAMGRCLTNLLP